MCGICGSYDYVRQRAVDPNVLDAMNATLIHRGPDGMGAHVDGAAGIAARRLAIIDIEHGDQPMVGADGAVCVAQNGEILNHLELRAELEGRGVRFRTRCDTEVLLHLYLHHGPAFVSRLRGMFAFAIWDRRERRLLLARDRFGIKPLYYSVVDGRISFASELKALLRRPDFPRDVDREALHSYLAFNSIPAPLTIFTAARKLPPGHLLVCSPEGTTIERYARPAPAPVGRCRTESPEDPRRGAPRAAARLGQRPFARRCPGRRTAIRRHRLLGPHRTGRADGRAEGFDVLDRLPRAHVQRARGGAAGRSALRHRPSRAGRLAPGPGAAAAAGCRLR